MPKNKLYVDSSAIIIGIEKRESNSALLLELIAAKRLQPYTSEKTLREVNSYFSAHGTEREAYFVQQLVRREFTIVPLEKIMPQIRKWRGRIKEKDLEHLATAKALRLPFIVAFERDFRTFKEYRTPKQFLQGLVIKHLETEY